MFQYASQRSVADVVILLLQKRCDAKSIIDKRGDLVINLLSWCDDNISLLKANGISFSSGLAQIPQDAVYDGVPYSIVPFGHRGDVPVEQRKGTLIAFYAPDKELFPRLIRIEDDIKTLQEYGGMCGFDLSPCIGMLRPRQRLSLLISSIYNCRCALAGVKVVPNIRTGDFGTVHLVSSSLPQCSVLSTGELGCRHAMFKNYGLFQLKLIIKAHKPERVLVYGSFSTKDAIQCAADVYPEYIVYSDRRARMRNRVVPYCLAFCDNHYTKVPLDTQKNHGGAA